MLYPIDPKKDSPDIIRERIIEDILFHLVVDLNSLHCDNSRLTSLYYDAISLRDEAVIELKELFRMSYKQLKEHSRNV